MARPKQDSAGQPAEQSAPKFVLAKNHGLLTAGKVHTFYPAGTEFDQEIDSALIARLVQSGAVFE